MILNTLLSAAFPLNDKRLYISILPSKESKILLLDLFKNDPYFITALVKYNNLSTKINTKKEKEELIKQYKNIMYLLLERLHVTLFKNFTIPNKLADQFTMYIRDTMTQKLDNISTTIFEFELDTDSNYNLIINLKADQSLEVFKKEILNMYNQLTKSNKINPAKELYHIELFKFPDFKAKLISKYMRNHVDTDENSFGKHLIGKKITYDQIELKIENQEYHFGKSDAVNKPVEVKKVEEKPKEEIKKQEENISKVEIKNEQKAS